MRGINRLTAVAIKAAAGNKPLHDGGGLHYLPHTGKWIFRFTSPVNRKRRDLSLGPVNLKAARDAAAELRQAISAGRDPLDERELTVTAARAAKAAAEASASALAPYARQYHAAISPKFRNDKHAKQWLKSLEANVFPTLGTRTISTITPAELLTVLLPLQAKAPETAHRVRMRLAAVWQDACLMGMATSNPAELIKRRMVETRPVAEDAHHPALPFEQIPDFVARLRDMRTKGHGEIAACLALEWTILAAARTGETIGAVRAELNLEANEWVIPAARMKGHQVHRVPLTARMLEIIELAKDVNATKDGPGPYLFNPPRARGKPMSAMAMLMLLRRMPLDPNKPDGDKVSDVATVHGFRAGFSSWARTCTKFKTDVIEAALAHKERDRVAAAYSHQADYQADRVALATAWHSYVLGQGNPA